VNNFVFSNNESALKSFADQPQYLNFIQVKETESKNSQHQRRFTTFDTIVSAE
jgi:hypothetical protein